MLSNLVGINPNITFNGLLLRRVSRSPVAHLNSDVSQCFAPCFFIMKPAGLARDPHQGGELLSVFFKRRDSLRLERETRIKSAVNSLFLPRGDQRPRLVAPVPDCVARQAPAIFELPELLNRALALAGHQH